MGRKIEFIKEKEIITIDLDDFKKIARLTSNLKLKEDKEINTYLKELEKYFEENKNHELYQTYKDINVASYGKELLRNIIELTILMKEENVSRLKYDSLVNVCEGLINANKQFVENKKEELNKKNKR